MAHQDQDGKPERGTHAHDLLQALQWLLTNISLTTITLREDCTWTVQSLIQAALLWAWSDERTLTDRFQAIRKIIIHLNPGQAEPAGSYQAFVKLLRKWTEPLLYVLRPAFRQRMTSTLTSVWTVAGWLAFACDGSRIDVPRTRSNEAQYSPKSKLSREAQKRKRRRKKRKAAKSREQQRQNKANVPQIWLTVMWHVGSGLPWHWLTGPSDSSERDHLRQMLCELPESSLLTADAGFVGYDLWQTIAQAGHEMLIRVGGNVKLLRKLGYAQERDGLVYLWPDKAAKQGMQPLVLRLIVVNTGRRPIFLVTSVMNRRKLTDFQAAQIYAGRWGIEVFYRHCKQTFDRRKLRSHNAHNAMVELHWSLLGVWAMGVHSHARLVPKGMPPQRISFVGILKAYRRTMREYKNTPDPGERLAQMLDQALVDEYERKDKTSRNYPRKKQETAAGPPKIQNATRSQVNQAKKLKRSA